MKNGGPYTIIEKEQRRLQVYKLYFEEKNSAVKIAEILDVIKRTYGFTASTTPII